MMIRCNFMHRSLKTAWYKIKENCGDMVYFPSAFTLRDLSGMRKNDSVNMWCCISWNGYHKCIVALHSPMKPLQFIVDAGQRDVHGPRCHVTRTRLHADALHVCALGLFTARTTYPQMLQLTYCEPVKPNLDTRGLCAMQPACMVLERSVRY
jgi:hypothetical protein